MEKGEDIAIAVDVEERLKQFTDKLNEAFKEFADILPVGHSVIVHPMPELPEFPWFAAILVMGQGDDPTVNLLENLGRAICFTSGSDYQTDPGVEHIRGFTEYLRSLPKQPYADEPSVDQA